MGLPLIQTFRPSALTVDQVLCEALQMDQWKVTTGPPVSILHRSRKAVTGQGITRMMRVGKMGRTLGDEKKGRLAVIPDHLR